MINSGSVIDGVAVVAIIQININNTDSNKCSNSYQRLLEKKLIK